MRVVRMRMISSLSMARTHGGSWGVSPWRGRWGEVGGECIDRADLEGLLVFIDGFAFWRKNVYLWKSLSQTVVVDILRFAMPMSCYWLFVDRESKCREIVTSNNNLWVVTTSIPCYQALNAAGPPNVGEARYKALSSTFKRLWRCLSFTTTSAAQRPRYFILMKVSACYTNATVDR